MEQRMRVPDGALEMQKFASPEEELRYLRERVRTQHEAIGTPDTPLERGRIATRELATYADVPAARVLHEAYVMPEHETLRMALKLEKEEHDTQMDGLLEVLSERGARNALSVAARMGSVHLEDDFHRMLVRYVAEGMPVKSLPRSETLRNALHTTLFEIKPQGVGNREQAVKETLASSEQLYVGLLGLLSTNESFSLEIAVPQGTEAASLYVAVPYARAAIAERLIASVFPGARIEELRGDYNIFVDGGVHAGAIGTLAKHPAFPFKTYESFEHDPLSVILAAFAKIAKHGEGAALQIVVTSEGERYNKHYQKIMRALEKGESVHKALRTPETALGDVLQMIVKDIFSSKKKSGAIEEPKTPDTRATEAISRKVSSRIASTNIRIIASAQAASRAHELIQNLAAPFAQFDDPTSNHIVYKECSGRSLRRLLDAFIFRTADRTFSVPLNMAELTSLMHFTAEHVGSSRELSTAHGKEAPAPVVMPSEGVVLGLNRYGASVSQVRFGAQDRLRHCYVIGQTGTGKTTMIKNMIIQDIERGEGVAFIDPHGNDIEDILSAIPPSRMQDVVYFDPAYTARPMGLNILEYDRSRPELKTLITDELYMIFRKLYSDVPEAFGPMFEQYYRNATMLVLDDPEGQATLADIPRVFADTAYRHALLARCGNPIVVQFWRKIAEQARGDDVALESVTPYISAKFDAFLSNEIIRPIVCQPQSSFDFRNILDGKKIFLANLSKGRLGERNMALLGLVLVSKFAQAAFSRADSRGQDLPPFYLYIDEFQNFTTPSIASILSEARKYKLSLTIAHQFLGQLTDEIKSAVVGNVGTKLFFRVGAADSEFLEKQVSPVFSRQDLEQLENYHAIAALLVSGMPATPFSMVTEKPQVPDASRIDAIKELSYRTFGRERAAVEADVRARLIANPVINTVTP